MAKLALLHNSVQKISATRTYKPEEPNRIEDIAVLPVFFKLDGKKAIVAGGSDAAAWKAELLAASGAFVHIYAHELSEAFTALLNGTRRNQFTHHRREWALDIFQFSAIALLDTESDAEAKAFYCAARAAGVPVNVIDKPAFCEFQFGTIVNRSPVIVSISTNGASPILGQAIRTRIETIIPSFVKEWAHIAATIRGQINEALEPGKARRAFWESFVRKAFEKAPTEDAHHELLSGVTGFCSHADNECGKVTLVGAGPGDAELLTLKAVRALQAADVILFDDLVSDEVLELARREAKRMLVGKRGGRESCKQDDINDMMVSLAKAGKNVVRLKGGDPMIFGRAGEEIQRLIAENISVSVVPGITSASAMAAQLGISLTHRDHAQSVRFITGHRRNGQLPQDIDWAALADPSVTTIFYMGGRTAGEIAKNLLDSGLSATTPVVICSSVSRPNMKKWVGSLAELQLGIAHIGYDDPVLIGIGNIFSSAQEVYFEEDLEPTLSMGL